MPVMLLLLLGVSTRESSIAGSRTSAKKASFVARAAAALAVPVAIKPAMVLVDIVIVWPEVPVAEKVQAELAAFQINQASSFVAIARAPPPHPVALLRRADAVGAVRVLGHAACVCVRLLLLLRSFNLHSISTVSLCMCMYVYDQRALAGALVDEFSVLGWSLID